MHPGALQRAAAGIRPRTATREQPPLTAARERPHTATPSAVKNKKILRKEEILKAVAQSAKTLYPGEQQ